MKTIDRVCVSDQYDNRNVILKGKFVIIVPLGLRTMQVYFNTTDTLTLRHRPVFWAVIFGCILFVLAAWALAGLLEGEWLGALIAITIGAVMGWFVFRQFLISFSITFDRKADRITYHDSKGKVIEVPLSRLISVACDTKLDTDNGEAVKSVVLHLDQNGTPSDIRLAAFKLRSEDVLHADYIISRWLGGDAPDMADTPDSQALSITVPVLPVAWLAIAFCAVLVLSGLAAIVTGEFVRAALLFAIGGGAGYAWLEKVLVRLDLVFDPAKGVIRMTRRTMLGASEWILPLAHFDGAELIEQAVISEKLRKFGRRSANVDLLFRNTRPNLIISLSPLGMPQDTASQIAAKINAWLTQNTKARA